MEYENERQKIYGESVPYLLQWYDYNRRILPWREEPTPYHVWVSEIMLQQTRVEAVKGYYDRFLTRLPDVFSLAQAQEEVLLKLWEGLGYYNRVRNMQKAAKVIVEEYGGELPGDYEKLKQLPGIGEYTAGAIASIAFGLPFPAVDGNVLRVMSRISCSEDDIAKEQTKKKLQEDLKGIMPKRSGDFNQSLMELGATVCLPNGKPLCDRCPVMHLCKAFHAGMETKLPVKSGKKERRIEERTVLLVLAEEQVLLHRRGNSGLLAGLWEFPNIQENREELLERIKTQRVFWGENREPASFRIETERKAKHIFSHVEWHMAGIRMEMKEKENDIKESVVSYIQQLAGEKENGNNRQEDRRASAEWRFVSLEQLRRDYPLPSAFEAYLNCLEPERESLSAEDDEKEV